MIVGSALIPAAIALAGFFYSNAVKPIQGKLILDLLDLLAKNKNKGERSPWRAGR